MDVIVASNKESPLLTSLERNLVEDPYSYRLSANFPNQSKSLVTVQPQYAATGTSHGSQLHFKLPRYGIVSKMVLRNTMVASGTNSTTKVGLGERVYSNIEMRSHNKVIQSQDPRYCQSRIDNLNQEANNAYTSATQFLPATWTVGVSAICYTPVFLSFFEKTSNMLDLSFVEELELVATVNTQVGMGLPTALTSGTYELLVWYVNLSEEAEQAYIAKNFPASQPLTMLAYDMYAETKVTTAALTSGTSYSSTIDLKTNNPVYATHFIIKDSTATTGLQANVSIDSFTINAVGREIMSQTNRENVFDTGSYGVSGSTSGGAAGTVTYNAGTGVLTYFWGMSKDRTYNSGAAAFKNLNNPQAVITYTATVVSQILDIYVVHEYFNLLTINPSDGSINRSLSD